MPVLHEIYCKICKKITMYKFIPDISKWMCIICKNKEDESCRYNKEK